MHMFENTATLTEISYNPCIKEVANFNGVIKIYHRLTYCHANENCALYKISYNSA